jgi:type VI secretion system protein VasG
MVLMDNSVRFMGQDYGDVLAPVKRSELTDKFLDIVQESSETEEARALAAAGGAGEKPYRPDEDSALKRFCQNFTERAKAGEIDPVFGRDREIRQMPAAARTTLSVSGRPGSASRRWSRASPSG